MTPAPERAAMTSPSNINYEYCKVEQHYIEAACDGWSQGSHATASEGLVLTDDSQRSASQLFS